ncbi:hypothetical protein [Selenomonas ruminantium]|uniref:hypothetical protein n=1 Tax=Selenomonas ruminantium TaxID=971 RepID=UPI00117A1CDF|nr:hypothetical protein [Selenomonas ruminantium]
MDFDLKPNKHEECLSLQAEVNRLSCENRIRAISLKYNISSDDISILVEGIENYLNQAVDDVYESSIKSR